MEIGIVGKPNVGKSTFFKSLTLADIEIANFPFTTIKPNVGVGYVRVPCACREFDTVCNPQNSVCREGMRFIPVKLIDVAGLVPGAHEGKGLGNQFMDDLRRAQVLIHVIDLSGRTDDKGNPTKGYLPEKDIGFLENEVNAWFCGVVKRNWTKVCSKILHSGKNLVYELSERLSGLQVTEAHIKTAIHMNGLEDKKNWSDAELEKFSVLLREISKPIVVCANKADLGSKNLESLGNEKGIIPASAEAELVLRTAASSGLIEYISGNSDFKIKTEVNNKQKQALDFIRVNVLERYGSTGIQDCINRAVFDIIDMVVVYPVENENRLTDSKGNVLADARLLKRGSTALDLAYSVHTDIGDCFIGAIDCKTKKKIGRDHILEDGDVIKIIAKK